jgi:Carboxypeptidase regulatory-like domain/TonB dependent receptor-like, beta-barrel
MPGQAAWGGRTGMGANWVLAFFLFLFGASAAMAQLPTATILGVVKDTSGAVVPGATLTARNVDTGQTRTTVSASDGSYRFPALLVGNYEVRAEQRGFQTDVRRGLTLTVTQEAVVNFTLQVGAVSQSVEVTAEAPLVNTTSGAIGALVAERQVQDLPLNGRNYVDLTLLQPGITRHRSSSPAVTINGELFSSNGAPLQSNYFTLDGAPIGDAFGGNSASVGNTTLGIDGIREVRVITNSFSAEYGTRVGAQVVLVSKGGTNNFHGSAFEYLRNSSLDAANFFDTPQSSGGKRLPPFRRNQYGGSLGGPFKRDKLFFFSTYEGLKQQLGLTNYDNVPGSGCFGAAGDAIWNGVAPQPAGSVGNCPQLGGTTPATVTIAPQIAPLLALYPGPNLAGNVFAFSPTQSIDENFGQLRVDYNISAKDSAFVRFTSDHAHVIAPLAFPQFYNDLLSGSDLLTLSETHIFSTSLLGTFRFSYSRNGLLADNGYNTDLSGPQYSFVQGKPFGQMTVGGLSIIGSTTYLPNDARVNSFVYSGDIFYTVGRHSLKFGTLIEHQQLYTLGSGNYQGAVVFANLASFLQGATSTYTALSAIRPDRVYHYNNYALYVQDDFRVVPRLTLNLGLRYEFNGDVNEVFGNGASLQNPLTDAAFTVGLPFKNPSLKNFGPRFGFAWDIFGDGKTSLRGGFAEMFDVGNVSYMLIQSKGGQPPLLGLSTVTTPGTLSLPLTFPPSALGKLARTIDYNLRQTHMLTYNLTLERQLPSNLAVSLSYAGSRGLNLVEIHDLNPLIPTVVSNGQPYSLSWPGLPRPNSNWTNVMVMSGSGDSWFNSLQFVGTKRFSNGLEISSAYTWERLIDQVATLGSAGFGGGSVASVTSVIPKQYDQGPADWEVHHAWHLSTIYRFPEMSGLHGFARSMLNGWWTSGILTAQTGLPFTTYLSSARSLDGESAGSDRPNLVAGRSNGDITSGTTAGCLGVTAGQQLGTPNLYYDPCAFSIQTAGVLGNEPRNILTAPGLFNLDFSVVKDTYLGFLGEGGNLQFRAEIFNILNHPNFSRPATKVYAGKTNVESPIGNAGQITQTDTTSRQIQFALKLMF